MPDTFSQVKEIILEKLSLQADFDPKFKEKITMEADFRHDLETDELDLVELIMAFEDKFMIEFPIDYHNESMTTVGEVVKYIDSHTNPE